MWTLESRISGNLGGSLIEPVDVLYEYDGPMIFTARIGILSVLVRKMTQLRDTALYVVVTIDPEKLSYLREGKLSVRGAFAEEACWIIELDQNYGAQRYWELKTDLIPQRYIPKAGVGLTHWVGFVPDDVEQINALLAIKFRGETLKADGMPFGKFKKLVDRSYAAARRALTPAILMGSRIASFDLEIAQPKFRSLLIAVKQPVFNPSMVRRLQRKRAIDRTILNEAVRSNQAQFAESIKFIAENVGRPTLDRDYTAQRYGLFYSLASILPTDDGDVSDVEFTTNVAGNISTVVFDRNSARAVRSVIQDAERGNITEIGVIVGLIDRSSSVLLNSDRGKSVRCDFPREQFVELVAGAVLQIGVALELQGPITPRPRRDVLDVRSFRVLNADDEDGEIFNVFG